MYAVSDDPKSDYYIWEKLLHAHPDFCNSSKGLKKHIQSGYLLDMADNLPFALAFYIVSKYVETTVYGTVRLIVLAITGKGE